MGAGSPEPEVLRSLNEVKHIRSSLSRVYAQGRRRQLIYEGSVFVHMDLLGIHDNRDILPAAVSCNISGELGHILIGCRSRVVIKEYGSVGG